MGKLSSDLENEVEDRLCDEKLKHFDYKKVDVIVFVVKILADEGN